MTTAKPTLELLRALSDEHVLRALMETPRLTRAELATVTGISKPTVGESIRRLAAAGIVVDTGARTAGRGRVGSYFALAPDIGAALVVSIAPEGIVAEVVDAHAAVLARAEQPVAHDRVPELLRATAVAAVTAASVAIRLAVVSAADPVDRASGRLVKLPDAPFLVGELAPAAVLADLVDGPVQVDNDVHWAARAERGLDSEAALDDFVYLYLGQGLGCAVVSDGQVRRGSAGIAGEIAHVVTWGSDGRARPLTEVFGELGLRRPGSTAIDTETLLAAVAEPGSTRTALGRALAGLVAAAVSLCDPSVVVLGGSWGVEPAVVQALQSAVDELPRPVPVRPARVTHHAPLEGARSHAVSALRDTITRYRDGGVRPVPTAGPEPAGQPV